MSNSFLLYFTKVSVPRGIEKKGRKKGLVLCCSVLRRKARCRRARVSVLPLRPPRLAPGSCVSGCSCGCLSCWNDSSRQASLLDREHFTQQQMPQALKYLLPLNGQGLALPQHCPEGWAGASRGSSEEAIFISVLKKLCTKEKNRTDSPMNQCMSSSCPGNAQLSICVWPRVWKGCLYQYSGRESPRSLLEPFSFTDEERRSRKKREL